MTTTSKVPVRQPLAALSLLAAAMALVLGALVLIAFYTPADRVLGISQKIFYFHVGSAFAMLLTLSCAAVFSLADLVKPSDRTDALARACLECGVVFGAIVLTTGPIWARKAWGTWWTWEPRLTLSLLVELLVICVIAVRGMAPDSAAGRRAGAAMAVMAAPAAYLIHVAVKLWGGNHPQVIQGGGGGIQSPEMRVAFWTSVAAVLLLAGALIVVRYRGIVLGQAAAALRLRLSAVGLRRSRISGLAGLAVVVMAAVTAFVPGTALAAEPVAEAPAPAANDAVDAPPRDLSKYKEKGVSGGALLVAAYLVLWVLVGLFLARTLLAQARTEAALVDLGERLDLLEEQPTVQSGPPGDEANP